MKELPLEKAFMMIEPGPVVMVSTFHNGKRNIMVSSWTMVLEFEPRIGLMTGPWNFSYEALRKTKECVISIPTIDIIDKVLKVGNSSGAEVDDKFAKFGLTAVPGKKVKAPLIKECLGNIECRVIDYISKHGIFVLEGVQAWRDSTRKEKRTFHAVGNGNFVVDGETLNYKKKMPKFPEVTRLKF